MKRILFALLITLSFAAQADGWRHGGGHYIYRPGLGWVFPTVVGGVIGYEIAHSPPPTTVVIQQPPVYVQQPLPAPNMTPPAPPYGYHWEAILDAKCNCYRTVMVQN